jgi:putative endonuclease
MPSLPSSVLVFIPAPFPFFHENRIVLRRLKKLIGLSSLPSGHLDQGDLGRLGEDYACEYLLRNNYAILKRNYWCSFGEIDIIAREQDTVVFVEVKSQYSHVAIPPERKVNKRKQRKLLALSRFYRLKNLSPDTPCRIDVVTVKITPDNKPSDIIHYKRIV